MVLGKKKAPIFPFDRKFQWKNMEKSKRSRELYCVFRRPNLGRKERKVYMDDLYAIFARNVAELRAERKMTQAQLAALLNYSDKAISKWERGEALPDVTVVKQIADTFGVTVDYLLKSDQIGRAHV